MKRSALFAACVLILACDPASETLDHADFAAVDSAGVEILVNDGPDRPLRVERTVTIGTLDGPPERQFHQISAVEVGPEEDLWVSDARGTIRRFDLQGEYLGEIGGKGEGPGEDPTGWGEIVFSGDTILALGLRPRLQLFSREGEALASRRPFAGSATSGIMTPLGHGSSGWLFRRTEWDGRTTGRIPRSAWVFGCGDVPGENFETFLRLEGSPRHIVGPGRRMNGSFFDGFPSVAVDGGGHIHYTHPSEYDISVYSDEGTLARRVRRVVEPVRFDPASLEGVDEAVRHAIAFTMTEIFGLPRQEEAISDEEVARLRDAITPEVTPTALPALDELLVTADGHVWVRRADRHPDPRLLAIARATGFARRIWPEAWRGPSHFDLFAPDGRYRGTAVLPASFVPMSVSRDAIYGVTRDDFDVEYVVGYEISSRGPDAAGVTDRQSNPSVGPSDVLAFRITLP